MPGLLIRRATAADAGAVAGVLNAVIAEGGLTIFDRPFSEADEVAFIASRGPRSVVYVAEREGTLVGVQSVDLFSPWVARLGDVATMGTWLLADARGQGIGSKLTRVSVEFARMRAYRTIRIQVLAHNHRALGFYRRLGFVELGVAREHVRVNGRVYDEVYLERALDAGADG